MKKWEEYFNAIQDQPLPPRAVENSLIDELLSQKGFIDVPKDCYIVKPADFKLL